MEVYEEVGGNAFNAFNAFDTPDAMTTTREEDLNQPAQIEGQAGVEAEGKQSVSLRAFKATSGNGPPSPYYFRSGQLSLWGCSKFL